MPATRSYAAPAADRPLEPHEIERREPGPRDVRIEILFCGVCHSDLHTARGEWGNRHWPIVPGHEIIGRVAAVGSEVDDLEPGEIGAVGCLVDSCRRCDSCGEGLEQYCERGPVGTYGTPLPEGGHTQGGYSAAIVVDRDFVLRVRPDADLSRTAPLLCAGITSYSPLRHWNVGEGTRVGVVGLGGLGHMGVKLADAMGAEVTLFTTSPGKSEDAKALGADRVVISTDEAAMREVRGSLDFVLDTVAAPHDLDPYLAALARDGAMTLVGVPPEPHPSPAVFRLIGGRRSLAGSAIGGIAETQEMLDFCADHDLGADVEMIRMDQIDEAYDRMAKGDVKFRFVIDMATL